jgi:hypothetical protein
MTSVLSIVWQLVSGGGGGAKGGGGGGLEQPPRITAQNTSEIGAKTRFPRLFIGRPAINDVHLFVTTKHRRKVHGVAAEKSLLSVFIAKRAVNT